MDNKLKISVIIPVFNSAKTIEECLTSLINQSIKTEIIVIDDGSTDQTVAVVKKFTNVKLLSVSHQGPAAARNKGAGSATGDILVFVDADMTFDNNFIKNLTKPILTGKSFGTFTKEELVSNWTNTIAKSWNLEYTRDLDPHRLPKNFPDKSPVFRSILKSEFFKVGGFDSVGYNDDWTLSEKLGYLADVAPGAIMYHKNPENLNEVWYQAKWIAKRRYKAGEIGKLVAIFRASLPFSLFYGIYYSAKTQHWPYLLFKIYFDLAQTVGIIEYFVTGKHVK